MSGIPWLVHDFCMAPEKSARALQAGLMIIVKWHGQCKRDRGAFASVC